MDNGKMVGYGKWKKTRNYLTPVVNNSSPVDFTPTEGLIFNNFVGQNEEWSLITY